jgi:hypothetical protein
MRVQDAPACAATCVAHSRTAAIETNRAACILLKSLKKEQTQNQMSRVGARADTYEHNTTNTLRQKKSESKCCLVVACNLPRQALHFHHRVLCL